MRNTKRGTGSDNLRISMFASISMCFVLICVMHFLWPAERATAAEDVFAPVKQHLMQEGFSRARVVMMYQPQPAPLFKTVAQTLHIREGRLDYDQFVNPPALARAREFLSRHGSVFARAEQTYGVDRYVIASLLLVETQFGQYTGRTPTLAILSTFALMDQEKYRSKIWTMLSPQDRQRWERQAFEKKLMDRSAWAYQELRALLQLADSRTVRVESCRGSVMGAIGLPQFLPSSLVRFGVDENQDGRIDLFLPGDAIMSVGNYLKGYGWCQAKTREEQEEVIWGYNHSRPYVRTVLEIASRLRQQAG